MKTTKRQGQALDEPWAHFPDRTADHAADNLPASRKSKASRIPRPAVLASSPGELRAVRSNLARRLLDSLSACQEGAEGPKHLADRPEFARALVQDALAARASDIHLEPREGEVRVRLRIDGAVSDVACLTIDQGKWVTNQFKALANLDPVARFTPKDSHAHLYFDGGALDLRLALAPCQRGEALSIRLLDSKRLERSIDDLGLTQANLEQLEDWLENVNGMFLSVGPTGSGKTTTVYSLLRELKFTDRIVVSIEDPVEYEVPGVTQVQLDEKHHLSFAEGVKAMLRMDPDFLMIGEIRDAASANAGVDAAITGRVLLSTVHARDAIGAVTALRNWGLPDHEIAESLAVVVAQRLVRRLCVECRKPTQPTARDIRWLRSFNLPVPKRAWSAGGCKKCNEIGYFGRTGIFELWRLNESDYQRILDHSDEHALRRHFHQEVHGSLLVDGMAKVADGVTSVAELRRACSSSFSSDSSEVAKANRSRRDGISTQQRRTR